jgi:hypothetical protein
MSTPSPAAFSSLSEIGADVDDQQNQELTLTPIPMEFMTTPAPILDDAKSMSGLEIGVIATAIALGVVVLCVILTVGRKM